MLPGFFLSFFLFSFFFSFFRFCFPETGSLVSNVIFLPINSPLKHSVKTLPDWFNSDAQLA